MSEGAEKIESSQEISVPELIRRQDKQLDEIRSELKDVAKITHENALQVKNLAEVTQKNAQGMNELVVVLTESSVESKHTRADVIKLEQKFEQYKKTADAERETLKDSINEKKSNQKLIIILYTAIVSSIMTAAGWIIGRS